MADLQHANVEVSIADVTIYVTAKERDSGVLLPATIEAAAAVLREYGVLCVENAIGDTEALEACRRDIEDEMARIKSRLLEVLEDWSSECRNLRYKEVNSRAFGRFELHGGGCDGAAAAKVRTLTRSLIGGVAGLVLGGGTPEEEVVECTVGAVVNTPNSDVQDWHRDGPHLIPSPHLTADHTPRHASQELREEFHPAHALTCFTALLDVHEALGATSFEPYSHLDVDRVDYYHPQRRKFITPTPGAGSIVVWDFRVLHRGNANRTEDELRPCLYSTLAMPWFVDSVNEIRLTTSLFEPPVKTKTVATPPAAFITAKGGGKAGKGGKGRGGGDK